MWYNLYAEGVGKKTAARKTNSIRAQRELITAAVIKRAIYYNHKHLFK